MDRSKVKARDVAARIPLQYYKTPDPVFRRKLVLAGVAAVASVIWIATMFAPAKTPVIGKERFSHGPVCQAHAAFGQECSACHVNFAMFGAKDSDGRFKSDAKCTECHLGGGRDTHSPHQLDSMTPNCGTCHSDHKGRDYDMKRVADRLCTDCHKALDKAMKGAECKYAKNITSFSKEHPEFTSLNKGDPGGIKFNHKYHMTEGIVLVKGGKPFTVGDMKRTDHDVIQGQLRKRGLKDGSAVRLECADCHVPEGGQTTAAPKYADPLVPEAKEANSKYFADKQAERGWTDVGTLKPPHKPGAFMAPANYANHCAACHQLTLPGGKQLVDHHLQIEDLKKAVNERVAGWSAPVPSLPLLGLPGKRPGFDPGNRTDVALRSLLEGKRVCGECHVDESGADLTAESRMIKKPNVPVEWLTHARFDHAKHADKNIDCRECHDQAYAYDANKAWDEKGVMAASALPRRGAEEVLIPNLAKCRECHSSSPTPGMVKRGLEAKHDCTECHGYHNGNPPRGAQRAGLCPEKPLDLLAGFRK